MISFTEYTRLKEKTLLLKEGGVAGHMSHLYDNGALTFSKLKEILTAASNGQLEGTEKTDGQNLFISYDVKTKEARSARNKTDIKNGGMSIKKLAGKFHGRGALYDAFVDAFRTFEKAVRGLSKEEQVKIFGPATDVYYNAEIMDPRNANVINYDKKSLVIHRVGQALFNKQTGKAEDIDVSDRAALLDDVLKKMQEASQDEEFNVIRNKIVNLQALSDDEALNRAVHQIEQLINSVGLSDNNTIEDYVKNKITEHITKYVNLPQDVLDQVVRRIYGEKGLNINTIVKDLDPIQKETVKQINKESSNIIKQAIFPLEQIIHDFSVEMLKGLDSAFVIDNRKEVQRLRKEVEMAINAIEKSGNETAHEILKQQLQKLRSADNVSSAAEGFVFDYDGNSYKFTGNFAPINAILGMFKYGRSGVPPLQIEEKKEFQELLDEALETHHSGYVVLNNLWHYLQRLPEARKSDDQIELPKYGINVMVVPSGRIIVNDRNNRQQLDKIGAVLKYISNKVGISFW